MSTTVNYKGSTIATVKNGTKTLTTSGKWLEGDIQLVDVTPGKYIATVKSTGASHRYVQYNGTRYYTTGDTFTYNAGDTLRLNATDSMGGSGHIYVNGVTVAAGQGSVDYTYTLPEGDIEINFGSDSASVNTVPAFSLQSKSVSYTPTETAQSATVTADSGYDGLSSVAVSVGAISGTYVGSQVPTQAAQTIHPSTTAQTIASGKYLTGNQTIEAVTTANLTAANIVSGVTVKVGSATDDDCVVSVTGTATEGVEGTYMFPLEQNNDGIYVPTITDFSEVAAAQDEQFLMLYGYNVAGGVFTYAAYYEDYEGYSECLTYGYTVDFSDSDTGGDTRNYGKASVYVTYGYYNGALKTDYVIYKDAYNTSRATATADKIFSGYTAFGPNGIIDGTATLQPSLQSKSVNYTPSETAQNATVTADNGYDGLSSVSVSVGAISNTYVGTGVTRQVAKTVTPTESSQTAVASGVYTTGAVTVGAISSTYVGSGVTRQAAQTIHPSASNQTIASGTYLTGTQIIEAVTTNLTADKIVNGFTAKIGSATDDDCVASILGTASGGGTYGTKTITANGTYAAEDDGYDGYSEVTVNVSSGGGGSNIKIGIANTPIPNILNMFYALENGTATTGEFTLAQSIPNTSTLIFDTGLSTVNGIFIADESQATLNTGATPENTLWAIVFNPGSSTGTYAMTRLNIRMSYGASGGLSTSFLNRVSAWEVSGGKLYATGTYNHHNNYTPFAAGHTYRWVAW